MMSSLTASASMKSRASFNQTSSMSLPIYSNEYDDDDDDDEVRMTMMINHSDDDREMRMIIVIMKR